MPARVGVEGRNAYQAVNSAFPPQEAIGVGAADLDGGGFDAALGFEDIDHFRLEIPALGPAGVGAEQHARPIASLGAAGTRVDRHEGVGLIRLSRQQFEDDGGVESLPQAVERFAQVGLEIGLLLRRRELVEFPERFNIGGERTPNGDAVLDLLDLGE